MIDLTGFRCNLCGGQNDGHPVAADREVPGCVHCGSSIRTRSVMLALSMELFGTVLPVADFPRMPGLRGIGFSDSADYANLLSQKFGYTNTYYHREPRFDITNIPDQERGRYDFVLCSEVLEHVTPPLETAFRNLFELLKPAGVLIVSVPFTLDPATREHFPVLQDWGIVRLREDFVLVNRSADGVLEVHENLVFHGGPGSTLEMRVLCQSELRQQVRAAGFRELSFYAEDMPLWGIAHTGWSLPFSARKEPFSLQLSCTADWAEQWEFALDEKRRHILEMSRLKSEGEVLRTELTARTEWAQRLDTEMERAVLRIAELQSELEKRTAWAKSLEKDVQERTAWALNQDKEVAHHIAVVSQLQSQMEQLKEQLNGANAELDQLKHSRAVRVGRKLGLG